MAYKDATSGKWVASVVLVDNYNKKQRKRKYGFKTKKDAEQWEFNVKNESIKIDDSKYTSLNDMCQLFLDGKKGTVDIQTYKKNEVIIRLHIAPHLENIDMRKINQATIINYRNTLLEKGLSNSRVNQCVKQLKQIYKLYKVMYNDNNDPFLNIVPLKYTKQTPINYYTLDEFNKFISVVDDLEYKALFTLMFYSGARSGEVGALTWKDINFKKGILSIDKSIDFKIKGVPYKIKPPKTPQSKREVLIDTNTLNLLKELKTHYKSVILNFNDSMFVFGAHSPMKPTTRDQRNRKYAELAELKRIRIHDFRHSHATMLLNMNNDKLSQTNMFMIVSKRLGHKDVNETLRTYGHLVKSNENVLIEVLNNLWYNKFT